MKSIKILLLSVVFTGGMILSANAQENKETDKTAPATPAAPVNPNAAEMTFEKEMHDYGTIKQGADGTYEFKFTNTGNEPLIITTARGSCGCTIPTYPKEPIMKGQSAVIKVSYDTKRVGPFAKTVTIESNAKTNPKILSIKGVVEASESSSEQTVPLKKEEGATPFAK
jgi:hypothetical protein